MFKIKCNIQYHPPDKMNQWCPAIILYAVTEICHNAFTLECVIVYKESIKS